MDMNTLQLVESPPDVDPAPPRVSPMGQSRPVDVALIGKVGHEMRNPLTVIVGVLESLLSGLGGPMSEPANELLELAARNSNQLQTLINDFVQVCRLEANAIPFRIGPLELPPLLQTLARVHRVDAAGALVRIELGESADELPKALSDPARLTQLLEILISNAIKFTIKPAPDSGPTVVQLDCITTGGAIVIQVRDFGCGIPAGFRFRAFEKFARAETVQALGVPGFGLGLAIARLLAEQMGGCIDYESAVGCGSTFSVRLPIAG